MYTLISIAATMFLFAVLLLLLALLDGNQYILAFPLPSFYILIALLVGIAFILFGFAACIKRLNWIGNFNSKSVKATVTNSSFDGEATSVEFVTSTGVADTVKYKGDETNRFPKGARGKVHYKNGGIECFNVYHMPE